MSNPIDLYLCAADEAVLDAELVRLGLLQSVTLRGSVAVIPVAGVAIDRVGQLCVAPPVLDLMEQPPVVLTPAEYAPGWRCNIRLTGEAAVARALLVADSPALTVLTPAEVPAAQIRWAGGSTPWDGLASVPVPVPSTPPPESLSATKARLRARLAERRWQVETGGIMVGGLAIATDDRSKLLLLGAADQARRDPGFTTSWKSPGGWVPLTGEQIVAAADAVLDHVRACFALEAELGAQLAATDADLAEISAAIEAFTI